MKYTKTIESVGDASITEHTIEGDYEEVLALFAELEAKDAVEYHGTSLGQHLHVEFNNDFDNIEKYT